ncbi:MAG: ATP-binding protein [Clostridiales Family XIII bacterium]|jgi:predicted AAA+ superfamily ATPase|nr:ATP-binding protein [Clostridiales Family XIII bacterium]
MDIISTENLLKVLTAFNPWWQTDAVRKELNKGYKRFAFHEASRLLNSEDFRRTVILTGARRVGKTTIQYQLIDQLLKAGVAPARILFVSLDHPLLKLFTLNEILDCYQESIYAGKDCYYFFDEVQYMTDWDLWVKTIYDTCPLSRTVATGSASPVLAKKATESGVGRWSVIRVPTLSFFEYCELLDIADRPVFSEDVRPTALLGYSKQKLRLLLGKLSMLQPHFNRYLLVGGFPEIALAKDNFMAQTIMGEDVVDKVLKRDIPSLYKIRNSTELERIFLYVCYHSSSIIAIETISKELEGVSRATVEDYIGYMESANLLYRSFPIDMGGKKVLKARTKMYIADAAIRNAVLMDDNLMRDAEQLGITVETAVYKHVAAFYYQNTTKVGYYRGGKKNNEIDVVVEFPSGKILIEVKYREKASIDENDAIFHLADEANGAIVVTKRAEDFGVQPSSGTKKILRLPAFAFLYLLGNAEKNGYRGGRGNLR